MVVCVTGGTGFVGSHIVRALLEDGQQVRVLHRESSKLDALEGLTFESAIGDVTDYESLVSAFTGCDRIYHVAAVSDYWRASREWLFDINVGGTRKVLEAAKTTGIERVVFTSSVGAIGLPTDTTPSDETVPFNLPPDDFPYGYSKVLAEQVVHEYVADGLDVVTVNPSVVIGPGDLNMISGTFVTQVAQLQWLVPRSSGGVAVCDVRDVAQTHLAAMKMGKTGERYIINTANFTNDAWFRLIADVVGVAPPVFPTPGFMVPVMAGIVSLLRKMGIKMPVDAAQIQLSQRTIYFDASKAHANLHKPQITMRQSVQDTYDWYKKRGNIRETVLSRLLYAISQLWHKRETAPHR